MFRGRSVANRADDYVFTRANGNPVRDFRLMWKNACAHAGVPELLFQDLRRTGARNLRREGVAEGIIMRIGDWRTRSVFERYAIVSRSDISDAIPRIIRQSANLSRCYSEMPDSRLSGPISTSLTWKLDWTDCKTRFSFRLREILTLEANESNMTFRIERWLTMPLF